MRILLMRSFLIVVLSIVFYPQFTLSLETIQFQGQEREGISDLMPTLHERLWQQQQIKSNISAAVRQLQNIYRLALKTASNVEGDDPGHNEALQRLKLATLENAQALARITESIADTQEELRSAMRRL